MAIPLSYNFRNLTERWITSLMTIAGIALVTAVFVIMFALGIGMERTLVATGGPLDIILLRTGAQAEINSSISKEQIESVRSLEGIAKDAAGKPLISPELVVVANLPKEGGKANVTIRGVGPLARDFRGNIKLVQGRWFTPGVDELVVGKGLMGRFPDLAYEKTPFIRGVKWKVVGIFEADGQAYESEIWGDLDGLKAQFKRPDSALLVRCATAADIERLIRVVKDQSDIKLDGKRHTDYYKDQNQGAGMLKRMGAVMGFVLSIGAIFGAANTMYAAVASRTREIATMRVLGFGRFAIWFSFMIEAAFLGAVGGLLGGLVGRLLVHGQTTGTANWQTFSEMAFQFQVTPGLIFAGVILATLMGAIGGFFPAFRASRTTIAAALRGL